MARTYVNYWLCNVNTWVWRIVTPRTSYNIPQPSSKTVQDVVEYTILSLVLWQRNINFKWLSNGLAENFERIL